jgi:hypothetical protein
MTWSRPYAVGLGVSAGIARGSGFVVWWSEDLYVKSCAKKPREDRDWEERE